MGNHFIFIVLFYITEQKWGIEMQFFYDKKIWLFFALLIMVITTVCFWSMNRQEKKAYANGRIVEQTTPKEKVIMVEWGRG